MFTVPAVFAAEPPAAAAHGKHKHTELGDHMEKMGRAFRTLGRQVNDASKNEDSLRLVRIIQTNAEAAQKLEPAKTADIPEADRAKFVADYRERINGLLRDLSSLADALKAGNNVEAANVVQKVKKDMQDGHHEFRKKMDDM
jgi:hypothetical protein